MSLKENFENHELPVMVEPRNHLGVPSQNDKELGSRHFCGVPVDSLLLLLHLKTVLDAVYLKAKFSFSTHYWFSISCVWFCWKKPAIFRFFMVGLPVVKVEKGSSKVLEQILKFDPFWSRDRWSHSIKNSKNVYFIKISTHIQICLFVFKATRDSICTQTPTFWKLYIAPLIFIFCSVPGQSKMAHTIVL